MYIDPADLPETLNLAAITRASAEATVMLIDPAVAVRELRFESWVVSANNPHLIYGQLADLVLAPGDNRVDYRVLGLSREIGDDRYQVGLR